MVAFIGGMVVGFLLGFLVPVSYVCFLELLKGNFDSEENWGLGIWFPLFCMLPIGALFDFDSTAHELNGFTLMISLAIAYSIYGHKEYYK